MSAYQDFLNDKIKLAEKTGFEIAYTDIHPVLMPHQKDLVKWAIAGGKRAIFASFGLGKTLIQLEIHRQIDECEGGNHLIVCPLGVKLEFMRDAKKIGIEEIRYITNSNQVTGDCKYYITNYERIRKGDINPRVFISLTLDESSILRGLSTETTDVIMKEFSSISFIFACTATPSPNRYLELINYAEFLGIMDRGQALTRFFQRDSTTAGNLTLYEKRIKEFWFWMSSWACFITKPSDLGYDNTGYDLPPIKIHRHLVKFDREARFDKKTGQGTIIANSSKSLPDAAVEKRKSIPYRLEKMKEILSENPDDNFLLWHHLEDERKEIQRELGTDCKSVWGSQDLDQREDYLIGFSEGKYKYLSTKPEIAGSGCNFQYYCNKAIFVGIDYKFNDFIQAVHRIYRFMQEKQVEVHIIYTDAEEDILKALEEKWQNHITLQTEMTEIIQEYGLNSDLYKSELKREMFVGRREVKGNNFRVINNDCVEETRNMPDNSVGLIVTSIPFGNHYEYSENYNCFGHNETNEAFFRQMDFLVPELYRVLQPGRIAAIHVKDRIRYSYMNGTGFTSIDPFSDETVTSFRKHGFHLLSRITITTDVVQENNQTYRLGWSEKCKDGTKMGNGLPEYVLIFRKAPTDSSNAYADIPVVHSKQEYTRAKWQLDAHAFWKSSGERLFDTDTLKKLDLSDVLTIWKELEFAEGYNYDKHVEICEKLDSIGKLPSSFMSVPPQSHHPDVWDDITRMKTLNSDQAKKNLNKHICPLQLDITERVIERYSNKGEWVLDPFGGIMSVPYVALLMDRKGLGIELNASYFDDGVKHCRNAELKKNSVLELFNL
ncbi:DNA methyltransferase [Emticicia sp. BO119]|uniref:DNA methyltransferase n=1 Tax=Emticicia sp. BO119 TaxID=2757768 RepID=UPI0015F072D3|nr:DNA methyltransferase [Emticicia sp. BO119]MBA4852038.1 DNA methylase N-4 [Emticicia sp. BO119]